MTPEQTARDSWQKEGNAMPLPPIEELRARADRFRRKIRRRNLLEYLAGAIIIVFFGAAAVTIPLPGMRIAAVTLIIGTCVVLAQLHRRGTPLTPPRDGGQMPVLEFQRRELVRQRDALDSILVWYLLPLLPGAILMHAVPWIDGQYFGQTEELSRTLTRVAVTIVIFGGVYWMNKRGARKLQGRISEIDAMRAA